MPEQSSEIAEALRNWFLTCPQLQNAKLVGIDFLGSAIDDFAINLEPSNISTSTDILGNLYLNEIQEQAFTLSNTKPFGAEVLQNLTNLGVLDAVVKWMIEQNKSKQLPAFTGVISCLPTANPILLMAEADKGYYQIQGVLKYKSQYN